MDRLRRWLQRRKCSHRPVQLGASSREVPSSRGFDYVEYNTTYWKCRLCDYRFCSIQEYWGFGGYRVLHSWRQQRGWAGFVSKE